MKRLTIAIPTFDRPEILKKSIPSLLERISGYSDQVQILILDNASAIPVADVIKPLASAHPEVQIDVIRNRANVGAHANIMKCYEHTTTKYMWLLGDDDTILPDALDNVLSAIDRDPEATFFNFTFNDFQREPFQTTGLDEFVSKTDYFPTLLFMSVCVYRIEPILNVLRYGYLYSYSWAPHLAVVFAGLGDSGRVQFCSSPLIEQHQLADRKGYWSVLNVFMGIPVLADLPMKSETRQKLGRLLGSQLNLEQLPYHLIENQRRDSDQAYALYTFDHVVFRNFYFGTSFVRRIKAVVYRLFVKYPRFGHAFITKAYPLVANRLAKGKTIEEVEVPDRWGRI